jgi:pimeloyl-ACP methyl ester carboxylesterase
VLASVIALMRAGNPANRDKPAPLAFVRRDGGFFGGKDQAPALPLDTRVLSLTDAHQYAAALTRNGFAAPSSWYLNEQANCDYARRAPHGGRLSMPVLFLHGENDFTCETLDSTLADPMRAACEALEEVVVPSGHWMAQEQPVRVNAALARWLARHLPGAWPVREPTPRV